MSYGPLLIQYYANYTTLISAMSFPADHKLNSPSSSSSLPLPLLLTLYSFLWSPSRSRNKNLFRLPSASNPKMLLKSSFPQGKLWPPHMDVLVLLAFWVLYWEYWNRSAYSSESWVKFISSFNIPGNERINHLFSISPHSTAVYYYKCFYRYVIELH